VSTIHDTYWRKSRPLDRGRVVQGFTFTAGIRAVFAGGGGSRASTLVEELSDDNRGQDSDCGDRKDCDHSSAGIIRVPAAGTGIGGIFLATLLQSNIYNSIFRELAIEGLVIVQDRLDFRRDKSCCLYCIGAKCGQGEDSNGARGGSGRVGGRGARVFSWIGKRR
jgi:hypothetical protein